VVKLFDRLLFPGLDWEAPFYRSAGSTQTVSTPCYLMAGANFNR
jgi:hypothetical protein